MAATGAQELFVMPPFAADTLGSLLTVPPSSGPSVRYAVARHPLVVHFQDSELHEVFAPAMAHLEEPGDGNTLEITVRRGAGLLPYAPAAPAETLRPRILFTDRDGARGIAYPAAGISGVMSSTRRRAVWYVPDPGRVPPGESSGPYRTLLQWWLSGSGVQIVHAGAVGHEGAAVLLAARGGSGKSTTSILATRAGLRFLGDDSVACTSGPRPEVHSLYTTATLTSQSLSLLGLSGRGAPLQEKTILDMAAHTARSMVLEAIVVPEISGRATTTLEPLTAPAVVRALAPSSLLNVPGTGSEELGRLIELARRVRGYRLLLGTDLDRIACVLSDLVTGVAARP